MSRGVHEDTAVEKRAMDVGHHRTDITCRVRRLPLSVGARLRVLLAVDVLLHRIVQVALVALIDSVDLPAWLDLQFVMSQDELADSLYKRLNCS